MAIIHKPVLLLLTVFIVFLNLPTFSDSRATVLVNSDPKRVTIADLTPVKPGEHPHGSSAFETGKDDQDGAVFYSGLPQDSYGAPYGYGNPYDIFGFPRGLFGFPRGLFGFPRGLFGFPGGIFGFPRGIFGLPGDYGNPGVYGVNPGGYGGYPGGYGGGRPEDKPGGGGY